MGRRYTYEEVSGGSAARARRRFTYEEANTAPSPDVDSGRSLADLVTGKPARKSSGVLRDFAEGAAARFYDAFEAGPKPEDFEKAGLPVLPIRDRIRESIDKVSEATPENPTRSYAIGGGVGGAAASLPYTVLTGGTGAPLIASSFIGGAGGALASEEVRRRGGGALAQGAAGLAGDIASGGLARAGMRAPGAVRGALSPSARAGNYVRDLELGEEGATEAASAMRGDYARGMRDVDDAYDAYRELPSTGTADSTRLADVVRKQAKETQFSPSELPEVSTRIPRLIGDEVGVDEIEQVRRSASGGMTSPVPNTRRMAREVMEAAEGTLDDVAAQSEVDSQAAKALREAIAKRRALGKAFPSESEVYDLVISPKTMTDEKAADAFRKILTSSDRDEQVRLVLRATKDSPEAARGVRKGLALAVLNASEEVASGKPTSQLQTLDKAATVLREAWGDAGFKHFRRLLSEQATANRARPHLIRELVGKNTQTASGVVGGIVGSAFGGPIAAGVGGVLGVAADTLASRLSPRTVRELAVRSLYDPEVYRQITRPPVRGVNPDEWASLLISSLVRRGVITEEEANEGQ